MRAHRVLGDEEASGDLLGREVLVEQEQEIARLLGLVKAADAVAKAQGNVVEVLHTRHGKDLDISEVELRLSVETSGHDHRIRVLQSLKDAGLDARIEEA